MSRLPSKTIDILKQTLKLYNSIEIDEIHIFTADDELQYIGTYNVNQQIQSDLSEDRIGHYRQLINAIGSDNQKLVNFSSGASETYICHVLDKFVVLYRLSEGDGKGKTPVTVV
ncbi:hypothetical protein I9W82_003139 [Candida metapsilosis]|uniref:Uncharacterized protein n=1 Tax=Candida metapsilosis TaxID=273372 RepID=A0A8H7ZIM2_9ASCO|nr:hypothetical protein I9W82_003139 [Candida metapsilosis]